jgi:hypothetical protein
VESFPQENESLDQGALRRCTAYANPLTGQQTVHASTDAKKITYSSYSSLCRAVLLLASTEYQGHCYALS